jgi:hypothetical protein
LKEKRDGMKRNKNMKKYVVSICTSESEIDRSSAWGMKREKEYRAKLVSTSKLKIKTIQKSLNNLLDKSNSHFGELVNKIEEGLLSFFSQQNKKIF